MSQPTPQDALQAPGPTPQDEFRERPAGVCCVFFGLKRDLARIAFRINVVLLTNTIRARFLALSMPNGFSKCPYCDLWVPDAAVLMHMATHPGYIDRFLGNTASSSTRPALPSPAPGPAPLPAPPMTGTSPSAPPIPLADRAAPTDLSRVSPGFLGCAGKTLEQVLAWLENRGEAGCLADLLSFGVVRPLGTCGCHSTAPVLRPGTRTSKGKRNPKPIACARCPRCDNKPAVSYEGTPFESERNKLSLLTYLRITCHWLHGTTSSSTGLAEKVFRGIVRVSRSRLSI